MNSKLLPLFLVAFIGLVAGHAADKKAAAETDSPTLRIHPKVFGMVEGWLSDGESPIATEINLDAAEKSRNQFDTDEIKQEDGWVRSAGRDGLGFLRYRVLESKGHHYKVEYQTNGGGSLTTASIIEFSVDKRELRVDGKPVTVRVLHVLSYAMKL